MILLNFGGIKGMADEKSNMIPIPGKGLLLNKNNQVSAIGGI